MVKLGNVVLPKKHILDEEDIGGIPQSGSIFPLIEDYYLEQLHILLSANQSLTLKGGIETTQKESKLLILGLDNLTKKERDCSLINPTRSHVFSVKKLLFVSTNDDRNVATPTEQHGLNQGWQSEPGRSVVKNMAAMLMPAEKQKQAASKSLVQQNTLSTDNHPPEAAFLNAKKKRKENNTGLLATSLMTIDVQFRDKAIEEGSVTTKNRNIQLKAEPFNDVDQILERKSNNDLVYHFHSWKGSQNVHIHWQANNIEKFVLRTASEQVFQYLNDSEVAKPSKLQIIVTKENKDKKREGKVKDHTYKKSKI